MNSHHQKIAVTALAGLSLLGFATGCANDANDTAATGSSPAPVKVTPDATVGTDGGAESGSGSRFADGTYSADGEYLSPGGRETVGVSLTVKDDLVTAVEVTPESKNPSGRRYQGEFADGISKVIVGKNIDDLKVSKVAGSSLTSGGFNDALEQIKADAGL